MSSELYAPKKFEDFAYVLDFLLHGKLGARKGSYKAQPLAQIIGEAFFTLLEATTKDAMSVTPLERIYIGKDLPRDKISHIIGRIEYNDLTTSSKSELPLVIEEIVKRQEKKFVAFLNRAQAITPRKHSLELIPGIGKKYTWVILRAREKTPFISFKDVKERTGVPDLVKLIVKRIIEELSTKSKYTIFTRPS
jgi:putative nucleotide binding protein